MGRRGADEGERLGPYVDPAGEGLRATWLPAEVAVPGVPVKIAIDGPATAAVIDFEIVVHPTHGSICPSTASAAFRTLVPAVAVTRVEVALIITLMLVHLVLLAAFVFLAINP